jgi:hypothetical protein
LNPDEASMQYISKKHTTSLPLFFMFTPLFLKRRYHIKFLLTVAKTLF